MSESEKKIGKLKRRFSKKPSQSKNNTLPEDIPSTSGKSATLPEGISLHQPHSESIFTKLKRRFHFGSKAKYDFKSFIGSPSKPHWMRRKSDDTQLRHAESPTELTPSANAVVTKAQSVKTQRKAKSDKEEVILIRKDKRVSVLCKSENGGKTEIIFTNEDVSDEDSSGAWGRIEEDPYATISSVKEAAKISKSNSVENCVIISNRTTPEQLPENLQNVPMLPDDHYPYARINPDRKNLPLEAQNPQNTFNNARAYIRGRKEPDYETLDEVNEQKKLLNGFVEVSHSELLQGDVKNLDDSEALPEIDPDYETLDEVKQRCVNTFQKPPNVSLTSPVISPVHNLQTSDAFRDLKNEVNGVTKDINVAKVQLINSDISPKGQQAPLTGFTESLFIHNKSGETEIEECMYDNPNVIIRKHKSDFGFYPRRGQTMYEPPLLKTPAEEELVEKLSSLLAPPLPLRNYQKDEVKGEKGKTDGCSARHSWASQTSRALEFMDNHYLRDGKRISPFSSNHEIDNARHRDHTLKSGTKKIEGNDLKTLSRPASKSPSPTTDNKGSVDSVLERTIAVTSSGLPMVAPSQTLSEKCGKPVEPIGQGEHAIQSNFCVKLAQQIVQDACERAVEQVKEQSNTLSQDTQKFSPLNVQLTGQNVVSKEILLPSSFSISQNGICSNQNEAVVELGLDGLSDINKHEEKITSKHIPSDIVNFEENHKSHAEDKTLEIIVTKANDVVYQCENTRKGLQTSALNDMQANSQVETDTFCKEEKSLDKIEMYKMQGARPKFKPLLLSSQNVFFKDNCTCPGMTLNTSDKTAGHDERKNLKEQLSDDSHTWDEAMSPSFSDMNFHEAITESFELESSKNLPTDSSRGMPEYGLEPILNQGNDLHVQETVYLDSDTETEDGLSIHKSVIVRVKRDLSVTRVAKPILYVNPRLLENTLSGPFTTGQSIDANYIGNGIFKWGRYFHDFIQDRDAVEGKLKSFFHFLRSMLLSESEWNSKNLLLRDLQEDFDSLQSKIEKRLHGIQDLPTFQDVRVQLLKTEELDNWVPEFSQCFSRRFSFNKEKKEGERVIERTALRESDMIRDDLHSDDCMVDGLDGTCPLGCMHSPCLSPTKPQDILADLLALSSGTLTCSSCGKEEDSDSEDEMITLETYAKTVCSAPSKSSPNLVNYDKNAVYCRALYGELAYTAKLRKPRSLSKSILVPACLKESCGGTESHISWNNWCSMDAIFKKLIPHISPRLDFQYLLKTYSEFKFFILKDRNRNLDLKGCFTKKCALNEEKCCRFEEFVFLKLLRDELRYFAFLLLRFKSSEALFLEERDIGFSLLSLLKLVLRNIHKMKNSLPREKVVGVGQGNEVHQFFGVKRWKHFRHSGFSRWASVPLSEAEVSCEGKVFHLANMTSFHYQALSKTLKDWMSPQEYMQDPNVLVSCRTVFEHADLQSLDLNNMRGAEEPKPLQEREDFFESMEQLQLQAWYWGPISYEQAALILKDKEDGSFLVRDSSDQKYLLSLSFKSLGEVHHTRIEHAKGLFSFWSQPESHGKARICEFIEKSIQNSKDGRFLYFLRPSARGTPPLPIRLLSPVSRNFRVATLKHLARFVVRQTVRNDHLDRLPVPEKVKRYLKNKQYYVEILDEDQWAFDGDYVKS